MNLLYETIHLHDRSTLYSELFQVSILWNDVHVSKHGNPVWFPEVMNTAPLIIVCVSLAC